jgi:hypothetical protein
MARTRTTKDRRRLPAAGTKRETMRNIRNVKKQHSIETQSHSIGKADPKDDSNQQSKDGEIIPSSTRDFETSTDLQNLAGTELHIGESFPQTNFELRFERPQPTMRPAIIRVFEDRMVRVTILRRDGSIPSASSVTARLIALSAVLASAAAFSPISLCHSMGPSDSRLTASLFLPFSTSTPLQKELSARCSCGGTGMKSFSLKERAIPIVTAAAAVAAVENVILIKAIFTTNK